MGLCRHGIQVLAYGLKGIQKAAEGAPDHPDVQAAWGMALRELAAYDDKPHLLTEAKERLERALALDPGHAHAAREIALTLRAIAEHDGLEEPLIEAIGHLKRALAIDESAPSLQATLGLILGTLAAKRYDENLFREAITACQKGCNQDPWALSPQEAWYDVIRLYRQACQEHSGSKPPKPRTPLPLDSRATCTPLEPSGSTNGGHP